MLNAVHTTIRDSRVVMPPQVVRLVEQVPEWLYPFVQVIDGDICRETIFTQEIREETWAEVAVRNEPIYGCEPAVIIGSFVLTGWGPKEVRQEQDRRQAVQETAVRHGSERAARLRAPWFAGAAVALTLIGLLFLFQSLRGGGGGLLAVFATAVAFAAVWQSAFDFGVARGNPAAAWAAHCLTGAIGCQVLLAEWLVARWFLSMSWLTPVVLVLGAILCRAMGRRFEHTQVDLPSWSPMRPSRQGGGR